MKIAIALFAAIVILSFGPAVVCALFFNTPQWWCPACRRIQKQRRIS